MRQDRISGQRDTRSRAERAYSPRLQYLYRRNVDSYRFFSDRLEIHSPDSLYGRMSVEDFWGTHPDARNPVLAVMTESLTDAEHRCSGIPTMRRVMQEAGLPAPVLINRQNECVVVLYNSPTEASQPLVSGS